MVCPFDCRYLKNHELSNDDDDGSEIVAKKLNLPHYYCIYIIDARVVTVVFMLKLIVL